jgi:hypothetical protein
MKESISNVARMSGLPQDVRLGNTEDTAADPISVVKTGSNRREEMEAKAKKGQKKQAEHVNKYHGGDTGVLPK